MRRAAKVDQNQPEIVKALRDVGAKVHHLHREGGGCPDLLVTTGIKRTFLLEVKMPGETVNKQQAEFIQAWPGEIHIVRTIEEAIAAVVGPEAMK